MRIASAGGFGHTGCVFNEWMEEGRLVDLVGFCPGYEGEAIDLFTGHPLAKASGARVFPDLDTMLEECRPEVLIVSTRPDQIPVVARRGLAAGCHLILEKPVALDRAELFQLWRDACAAGRRVAGMLSMRSYPGFAAARECIRSGAIGEPVLVNTRKSYKWGTRPDWFNDREKYGGTFPWVGIHNLDLAHFLTGRRAVRVQAQQGNLAHPNLPRCEDVCTALFELEGGIRMTATVDLCRPDSAPTHGDDWVRVVGTEGVLEVNESARRGVLLREGTTSSEEIPMGERNEPVYTRFLATLSGGDAPFDSTVFHLTDAALAARDAADSGQAVTLNPAQWDA